MILKLLSLSARFIFLLIITENLPEYHLTEFVLILTLSVIFSRIISFGIKDNLALKIKGDINGFNNYKNYVIVVATVWIIPISYVLIRGGSETALLVFVLSISQLMSNLVMGLVRTFSHSLYEVIQNLPWLLVTLTIIPLLEDEIDYKICVILYSFSVFSVSFLVFIFFCTKNKVNIIGWSGFKNLKQMLNGGLEKMLADALITLSARGVILWPSLIMNIKVSNSITLSLSAAEACWQLMNVYINKDYSIACKTRKFRYKNNLLIIFSVLVSAIILVNYIKPITNLVGLYWVGDYLKSISPLMFTLFLIYLFNVSLFMYIRCTYWVFDGKIRGLVLLQLFFILIQIMTSPIMSGWAQPWLGVEFYYYLYTALTIMLSFTSYLLLRKNILSC
ncbi:membrane hypothetical protein [Vibrio chagasii]|nr:membrane hypothetical protein [Vibrio chagasii]CAH6797629.1 membrane hypothetical protein [Vibrio chagasii]CAH7178373.1 membrane hypothetical protein [Vibrio chagasii]CAH7408888.1 membrane hypothetical protein [Vibrio chagasii]